MRALAAILFLVGCTPSQPSTAICPAGHGPVRGMPQPQVLADGKNHPNALLVDGGTVYFVDQGPPLQASAEGEIVALDVCSARQTLLASQQARPAGLVLEGGTLYWAAAGLTDGAGQVCRLAPGGMPDCFATGEARPAAVAVENGVVYWVNRGRVAADGTFVPGTGALRRFDGASTTLVDTLDAPSAVAVRGGVVTWASEGRGMLVDLDGNGMLEPSFEKNSGAVERWAGGTRSVIVAQQDAPIALVVDAAHTWFVNRGQKRGAGALAREDGVLQGGFDFPGGLFVDGSDAFIAVTGAEDEMQEGHIVRVRPGADPLDIAGAQQLPRAIAADRHLVYWVDFGRLDIPDGQLLVRYKDEL
jgi:hypothetical protein